MTVWAPGDHLIGHAVGSAALSGTFHQDGRCIYADDRAVVCLIHETGTAPGGDQFDNLAVYTVRFRSDGQVDRGWTVDLDAEHCEAFWEKILAHPQRIFPSSCGAPVPDASFLAGADALG